MVPVNTHLSTVNVEIVVCVYNTVILVRNGALYSPTYLLRYVWYKLIARLYQATKNTLVFDQLSCPKK